MHSARVCVCVHRCFAGDIERTKWYRCYFIEIENYEKHIHISLENIVSSIFCSSLASFPYNAHAHHSAYI